MLKNTWEIWMKRLTILATENKLVGRTIDIKLFLADLFVDLWYTWDTEGYSFYADLINTYFSMVSCR